MIEIGEIDGYKYLIRDGVIQQCPYKDKYCGNWCPLFRMDVVSGEYTAVKGVSIGCGNPEGDFYPYED
jgi:hypothetical protein